MNQWEKIYQKYKSYGASLDYLPETVNLFKQRRVERILDLGCGSGKHAIYLSENGYDVYGFDISQMAIETAREITKNKNLPIDFRTGSMYEKFPYKNDYFDAIVNIRVINHGKIQQIRKTIREIERVLKPGGLIFIGVQRIISRQKTEVRFFNSIKVKMLDENTYYPLEGREKGIIHYIFNKKLIKQEFKNFKINKFWLFRGKEKWERYYYFIGELKNRKAE